jgi:hypothetical protein
MCDRASEIMTLAQTEGLGSVTRCSCGTISLHLGGVTLRMEQVTFQQATEMCQDAVQALALQARLPQERVSPTLH